MKNRRGMKHIEVILSFILFVSLGAAAIYYFNPFVVPLNTESTLQYVFERISENSSINIEKYTMVVSETQEEMGNLIIISLGKPIDEKAVSRAIDSDESEMKSDILNLQEGTIVVELSSYEKKVFFIYLGEDFNNNPFPDGERISPGEDRVYEISSFYQTNVLSEKRLEALKSQYNSNYGGLKEYFRVPQGRDFGFEIRNIKAEKEIPSELNVFIKTERKEILLNDDAIEFARINVKIW